MLTFYKYHGAGNDFVLINGFEEDISELTTERIKFLCSRRYGIGADGLMILKKHPDYDFEMEYFNADGSGATMCGNGGRCITGFANKLGLISDKATFLASDGEHEAILHDESIVSLKMNNVNEVHPFDNNYTCYTGSPHYIKFVENVNALDIIIEGREIRYSDLFQSDGINVNFVQINDKNTITVRTYERGVEDETLSCGTGSVASALTYAEKTGDEKGEYMINVKGGKLKVSFEKENDIFKNIWLTGPAVFVYKGTI